MGFAQQIVENCDHAFACVNPQSTIPRFAPAKPAKYGEKGGANPAILVPLWTT
jgi:hypothetical protein